MTQHADDNLMSRFDDHGLRRFRARDGLLALALAAVLLVLFEGASIRRAGEQMNPGVWRDMVLTVGKPAGWIADRLPLEHVAHQATAWLSPDSSLSAQGSFSGAAAPAGAPPGGVPPGTRGALDPPPPGAPAP